MNVEISQTSLEEVRRAGAEATAMAEQAHAITIRDGEHFKTAGECLQGIKGELRDLETRRKTITGPLHKAKKAVDALFKPATESLKAAEKSLKTSMGNYVAEIQRQQDDATRAAAAAAAANKPVKEVEALLIKTTEIEAPRVEGVSTRQVTKFEIEDASQLPRNFLVPDMVKIRAAVMSGVIPAGVRTWEETSIAARSN